MTCRERRRPSDIPCHAMGLNISHILWRIRAGTYCSVLCSPSARCIPIYNFKSSIVRTANSTRVDNTQQSTTPTAPTSLWRVYREKFTVEICSVSTQSSTRACSLLTRLYNLSGSLRPPNTPFLAVSSFLEGAPQATRSTSRSQAQLDYRLDPFCHHPPYP